MGNSELTPAVKAETKRDGAARDRHSAYPAAALSNPLPLTHQLGQNSQNILAIQRTFGNDIQTRLLATITPLRVRIRRSDSLFTAGYGSRTSFKSTPTCRGPAACPRTCIRHRGGQNRAPNRPCADGCECQGGNCKGKPRQDYERSDQTKLHNRYPRRDIPAEQDIRPRQGAWMGTDASRYHHDDWQAFPPGNCSSPR